MSETSESARNSVPGESTQAQLRLALGRLGRAPGRGEAAKAAAPDTPLVLGQRESPGAVDSVPRSHCQDQSPPGHLQPCAP